MGLDQGMSLVETIQDVEAVFVNHDNEIFLSSGLQDGGFELMNDDYVIVSD